jgi:uncharacterized protein (DUF885 family)
VIAYTAGRAEIEALLSEYRAKAGAGASLRDFHDRLLCYGSTPFSIVGPELLADLAKPLAEVRANHAHPALAQFLDDLVVRNGPSDHGPPPLSEEKC